MTTKYCMRRWNHLVTGGSIISENQKFFNHKFGISEIMVIPGDPKDRARNLWRRLNAGMNGFSDVQLHIVARCYASPRNDGHFVVFPSLCAAPANFLRERPAARARKRSIWPLGSVTQISPIHSSLTPDIGLALKLVRLTTWPVLPRSIVFR